MRAENPYGVACKNGAQKRPQAFLYPEIKRFFRSQLRSPVRSVRRVTLWMVPSGS